MRMSPQKDTNVTKYYILTKPTRLSDLALDDLDADNDFGWRDRARRLQARRWRKLKHQLV